MKLSSSILALLGCITLAVSQSNDIPLPLITNRSPAYSALNFQPNYNEQSSYQQQPVQAIQQQQQQQQFESSTGMKTSKISESEKSSTGAYSSSSTGQAAEREVISIQPISTSSGVSEYNVTIRPPQQQQRMPKLNVTIQPIVTANGTAFNISIQLLSSTAGMASSTGAWDQPRECIVNGSSVHCEAANKSSSTGAGGPLAILDKVNASSLPAQKITIQPISTSTGMGQLIVLSSATGRLEKLISVVPVTSSSGFQEFNLTIQSPEALKSNASSTGAANNTSTSNNTNANNTSSTGMQNLPMMDRATGSPSTILLQPINTSSGLGGLITISTSTGLNELVSILPVVASDGRREFNVTMQPASSTAALQASTSSSTGLASSSSSTGATKGVAATNNSNRLRRIINRP